MLINSYQEATPWMATAMPDTTIAVIKCHDSGTVYHAYFHAPTGAMRCKVVAQRLPVVR